MPSHDLDYLRSLVPIERFLRERYDTEVRGGRATAPWDPAEKSAALTMSDEVWFDHRLGRGGSIFDLVMVAEGASFKEALEVVAGMAGVTAGRPAPPEVKERAAARKHEADVEQQLRNLQRRLLLEWQFELGVIKTLLMRLGIRVAVGDERDSQRMGELVARQTELEQRLDVLTSSAGGTELAEYQDELGELFGLWKREAEMRGKEEDEGDADAGTISTGREANRS